MDIALINKFHDDYTKHLEAVRETIDKLIEVLDLPKEEAIQMKSRAYSHDKSKMYDYNEFEGYILLNRSLEGVKYGSEEYDKAMKKHGKVIQLHHKNNDHHPEHFKNGIRDMNKFQIYEMICDWIGAFKVRNNTSNWKEGFEKNKIRFNIPDDVYDNMIGIAERLICQ